LLSASIGHYALQYCATENRWDANRPTLPSQPFPKLLLFFLAAANDPRARRASSSALSTTSRTSCKHCMLSGLLVRDVVNVVNSLERFVKQVWMISHKNFPPS
jgi:hypothetical protein